MPTPLVDIMRIYQLIDNCFFLAFHFSVDDEEGDDLNPDLLIGKALLSDLVSESAKLKSMGLTNKVSVGKIVVKDELSLQSNQKRKRLQGEPVPAELAFYQVLG